MSNKMNRREFLNKSLAASIITASTKVVSSAEKTSAGNLPLRKIGNVSVSRLIIGGNPISGNAHGRDLRYLSSLMRKYFLL